MTSQLVILSAFFCPPTLSLNFFLCKSTINKIMLALSYILRVIDYNFPIILSLKTVFIILTNGAESDEMLILAMYDYLGQAQRMRF